MFSNLRTRAIIPLAIASLFVISSIVEVSAIKCWRCSSDASNAAFCNDPFNASLVSEKQKRWSYVECSDPQMYDQESQQRAVCKKVKRLINDKIDVLRSCYWENVNASKNDCMNSKTPSFIKTIFCETCSTDGCNGAAMNPVIENGNAISETINPTDKEKDFLNETSTVASSKSELSSDHEVLVTKNITTCNVGSVQDDDDEFIVELMLKVKKSKKRN